jgi:hypothetical protein
LPAKETARKGILPFERFGMKYKLHTLAAVGALALAASGVSLAQNTVSPGQSTMTPSSPTTPPTHPTEGATSNDRLPAARGTAGDTTDQRGRAPIDERACAKLSGQERMDCLDQAARDRGAVPPSHRTDNPPMDSSGSPAGTQSNPSGTSSGTRSQPSQDSGGYGGPSTGTGSSSSTK